MVRLGHMDAHCAALFPGAPPPPAAVAAGPAAPAPVPPVPPPPPPLAQESLQGYVMLLSGHFQGFCRDLYSECVQFCAGAAPIDMQTTIQAQFTEGLALSTGNPTIANIRRDFERFSFILDLSGAAQGNAQRITQLGHLNYWRNHVAHQKATPPPQGVPAVLTLADVQAWRASCDGLATTLDDIMKEELRRILGAAPW
jgi:hypothetical protein